MKVETILRALETTVLHPEQFLDTGMVYRWQDDFEAGKPNGFALAFPDGIDCKIWTDAGRFMAVRFRDWSGGGASLRTHTALVLLMRVLKEREKDAKVSRTERSPKRILNRKNMSRFFHEPQAIMMLGMQSYEYEQKFSISSVGNGDLTFGIKEEWGTGLTYDENQTVMNALILLAFAMQEDNTIPRP